MNQLRASRLIHVGNVVIDITLRVQNLPPKGGDVIVNGSLVTPGGAFNVMVSAVRQGLSAVYGGILGIGPFGSLAATKLAQAGITVIAPPEPRSDTGFVICLIDATGERTFVTTPGAETTLAPHHLSAIVATASDIVYVSGYSLLYPNSRDAILGWLFDLSEEIMVVFDPGPLVDEIPIQAKSHLMNRANWVMCNAKEASSLTGIDDPEKSASQLVLMTTYKQIVVRDGSNGCILSMPGERPQRINGYYVHATDTNGAGDAHSGAFLAALINGASPFEAARWANAAAALAVTRNGPATSPTREEVAIWIGQDIFR